MILRINNLNPQNVIKYRLSGHEDISVLPGLGPAVEACDGSGAERAPGPEWDTFCQCVCQERAADHTLLVYGSSLRRHTRFGSGVLRVQSQLKSSDFIPSVLRKTSFHNVLGKRFSLLG